MHWIRLGMLPSGEPSTRKPNLMDEPCSSESLDNNLSLDTILTLDESLAVVQDQTNAAKPVPVAWAAEERFEIENVIERALYWKRIQG